ncbi:Bacterial transcriptional regulator [compost metagenome]
MTLVTQVGSVLPLLGSSTGLVFNTYLPEAETAFLRDEELALPEAPSAAELQEQMAQIRTTGLHPVHGLLMPGVNALSAPLFAIGNKLAGVITVVGAASVFHADTQGSAAERLHQAARAISLRMGGRQPE